MTQKEYQKILLARIAFLHGRDSAFYIRLRDKMMRFSDKDWERMMELYVNENDEIDFKRALSSIRTRRR